MTEFIETFINNGDYSLVGMRQAAIAMLPSNKSQLDALHVELNRGRDVLEDEDLLNMYLYSFGKMHKFKMMKAILCLFEHADFDKEDVEIYDWGCGQGIATICLLDYLNYCEIKPIIKRIYLVDQSNAAINRASAVIDYINHHQHITTINKDFNDLSIKDFPVSNIKKIHLFSNILDVDSYNLYDFAGIFKKISYGENYIVCVGPCYNKERVDEFFEYVEPDVIFNSFDYERGEWVNDWSLYLRVCKQTNPLKKTFKTIVINKDNFPDLNITISRYRTAYDSTGNPFGYYWVSINDMICCSGDNLTNLLGPEADDTKIQNVLLEHDGKFCIVQAEDEEENPIFIGDENEIPLLVIRPRNHFYHEE